MIFRITLALLLALAASLAAGAQPLSPQRQAATANALGADSLPWPLNVRARLDTLLAAPAFESSMVGLAVYDLTADSSLCRHNARQTMRPASCMKLLTAIAAIDRLGGGYEFRTSLSYVGEIADGTLRGDVYCIGGFDPRFNADDMLAFVESIRQMGVDTIRGRIVADRTMMTADTLGSGWCWDDDNPALSPLLVSRKTDFTRRFAQRLAEAGVAVEATLAEGAAPSDAYNICTRAHSIDQMLAPMMKESDNLYAEAMFFQIAASTGASPAEAKHAAMVEESLIRKAGLNPKAYRIADGSGLSLYNYVSPELLVALLRYAWNNSNLYPSIYYSLPTAAEDGTLKKRMRGTLAAGNVRAKTGTLTGVSSLAGYCTAPNGHELCFAIINQGVLRQAAARAFQDKVCEALCRP